MNDKTEGILSYCRAKELTEEELNEVSGGRKLSEHLKNAANMVGSCAAITVGGAISFWGLKSIADLATPYVALLLL